jgi:octaprenyl-diphosphate synthase
LSGAATPVVNSLHQFGLHLGIAFQMIDDVLDYDGDPQTMGKNVGDDLTEGKVTLPLIHVLREGTAAQQAIVREAILARSADGIDEVVAAVNASGALEFTRDQAARHHQQAMSALEVLGPSAARDALHAINDLSVNRDH